MDHDRGRDRPSRRAVLTGTCAAGAAVLLAGCQTYGETAAPAAPDPDATGGAAPATAGGTGAPAAALAAVADIPVGGGRIFPDQGVVLTQPTSGTIRAFSARCTHQGCTVSSVSGGGIVCACHNSVFDIADGSVRAGPADRPLPPAAVTVEGDSVRLA